MVRIRRTHIVRTAVATCILTGALCAFLFITHTPSSKILQSPGLLEAQDISVEPSEYAALIEQQRRALRASDATSHINITSKGARGNQTLTIVFVKPATIPAERVQPLINALTQSKQTIFSDCSYNNCKLSVSLAYVPTYYTEQSQNYGVSDFNLRIIYAPVIRDIDSIERVGDMGYAWGKNPFGITNLYDTFEATLVNDPHIDADSPVIFIFFDDSYTIPAENSESLYEHKAFRSFALENRDRAYVNAFSFSPEFASELVTIVAHEALHLYGANDKYIENPEREGQLCKNTGYGEPHKTPLFPQETGDIMCMIVQRDYGDYLLGNLSDNTLVINQFTAREIGWTD